MHFFKLDSYTISSFTDKLGIFSLSEKKDNLLMWSHYSDSHRGICLGFDVYSDDFFKRAMHVNYETEYPLINLYAASEEDKLKILLTKSNDWHYEEEWRLIELNGEGVYNFPTICLKEIIFGCKISEKDKENIINLIGDKFDAKLYQAEMKDREFGLNFVEINI